MTGEEDVLFGRATPNWHLVQLDAGALDSLRDELSAAYPSAVIRVVRGRKAGTADRLLDELGAAFQLPSYFGGNWNALDECWGDARARGDEPWLLLVSDGAELLRDDRPDELRVFHDVIARLHAERPFHVLVQERPGALDAFAARLDDLGLAHDRWPAAR